jgi:hypothetical protein
MVKLANHFDSIGLTEESDFVDQILQDLLA